MFLKKMRTKSGRIKLAVYESYWDAEASKSRQRSVRALGYVDELEKEHDDPISWAKSVVDQMNAEHETENRANVAQVEIRPFQSIEMGTANRKNAGSMVVVAVYCALGIEAAIRGYSKKRCLPLDLNAVLRLLVVEQIVGSSSVEEAWQRRDHYFFGSDFAEDDVQGALDELSLCSDSVYDAMEHALEGTDVAVRSDIARKRVGDEAQDLVSHIARTITRLLRRATLIRESVIREELSLMNCSALDDDWWLFAHRSDASDLLVDAVGLPELKYKYLRTADMRSILDKAHTAGLPRARHS